MKSSLIILLLCAFIALCYSTPVPQEEAPNRPFFNLFSTANQAITEYGKRGAQAIGNIIDGTTETFSNGITTIGNYMSNTVNRPFQPAEEA